MMQHLGCCVPSVTKWQALEITCIEGNSCEVSVGPNGAGYSSNGTYI